VCAKNHEDFFEIGPTNQTKETKHLKQAQRLKKERRKNMFIAPDLSIASFLVFLGAFALSFLL
jgi:hypothetical protein